MSERQGMTGVVLMTLIAVAGCGRADAGVQDAATAQQIRMINVEVHAVEPRDFTNYVRVVGTVEAERDVTVSAEEGGVVRGIVARKGATVRAGEPLIRIDDDVLRAQLEQAVSQAELAEETWQRQKRLWEEERVGTELAYLGAKYGARTARAQAQVLAERVARTTVRAPITGLLDDRSVELGGMVAPGTPVARVLDVDTVKVVAGVPERYATAIARGAAVVVTVDALGGREFTGSIDFVGAAVAGDTRTFQVEVQVPNPGVAIKPGMVAQVEITSERLEGALVVPRQAVLRRESGYTVYVAARDGDVWRAESRPVTLGASHGQDIVVAQGLVAGELVVVVGHQQLVQGDAVEIVNADAIARPTPIEGGAR